MIHVRHIVVSPSDIRIMGSNRDTVKIENNGVAYMKFHAKDLIERLSEYHNSVILEIVGRQNLNEWMGIKTPQIFIDDYDIQLYNPLEF